jgi:hypothetical protein
MIENLRKCNHSIDFIRADLLEIINAGGAVDFLMVENLLHKTMDLKRDIERYLTAKELDHERTL